MRVLVYGAGPLGSVFAAKMQESGHEVSLLARGQRLADLREHGIVLHDVTRDTTEVTRVNVVETLAPDDAYDLVLVIMRKNHALRILPVLAENSHTPNVLFLMNNAAGPDALVEALGRDRVLMGFPGIAGYREGHLVHCLLDSDDDEAGVNFGEVDGRVTERTLRVAEAIDQVHGFRAVIRRDMDAWLKCHVGLLFPSLAPALYMCGTDRQRLVDTRDAVLLAVRAVREAFRVLRALGYPIVPKTLRLVEWIPEPVVVFLVRRLLSSPLMDVALVRHAEAARDEAKHLTDEFIVLARESGVPTPNIDRLYPYLDAATPNVPAGRAEIPLDFRGVVAIASVVTAGAALVYGLSRRCRARRAAPGE